MVSSNALQRTFRLRYGTSTATCFTIDVDGRQYIVTARHALPGISDPITVQLQHDATWKDLKCAVVGVGAGDVDIAVLAPPHTVSPSHPLEPTTKSIFLSQDAFFLGFPYGLHSEIGVLNANFPLPLVKKACVSFFSLAGGGPKYLLLDGHNNPGFSGGPVVYAVAGQLAATNVAGVVSGYRFEWDKVFVRGQETDLEFKYNTGIVVAYSIEHAVDLIRSRPIGAPLIATDA